MNNETRATYEHLKHYGALRALAKNNATVEDIALAIQAVIDEQLALSLIDDLSTLLVNVAVMQIDTMQIAQQLKRDAGTYSTDNYDDVHF